MTGQPRNMAPSNFHWRSSIPSKIFRGFVFL